MLYKIEIVNKNRIIYEQTTYATHPNQLVRKAARRIKRYDITYSEVYIMNDYGEIWIFSIKEDNDVQTAKLRGRNRNYVDSYQRERIFNNQISIREVLR